MLGKQGLFLLEILFIFCINYCTINPEISLVKSAPNFYSAPIDNPSIAAILDAKKLNSTHLAFLSSYVVPFNEGTSSLIDQLLHVALMNIEANELLLQNSWNIKLSSIINPLPEANYDFFLAKIIDSTDKFLIFLSINSYPDSYTEKQLLVISPNFSGDILELRLVISEYSCRIYALEAVKKPSENFVYFILIKCPSSFSRYLLKCPLGPNENYNNCQEFRIPLNSNSGFEPHDNLNSLRNKIILFYQDELFVGITCTDSYDTSFQFCDSIMNGKPPPTQASLSLNKIDHNDNIGPSFSYTKFILSLKDGKIVNIGFDCSDIQQSCYTSRYLTISIYDNKINYPYFIPKKAINLNFFNTNIVDGIISMDQKYIHFLANKGDHNSNNHEVLTFTVEINSISNTNNIDPKPIQNIYFINSCLRIIEITENQFVIYCLSNLFDNPINSITHEIFFILLFEKDEFKYNDYLDRKYSKFYNVLIINPNFNPIRFFLIISSSFYIYYNNSLSTITNKIYGVEPPLYYTKINSVVIINNNFYFGGCSKNHYNENFKSIIFFFYPNFQSKNEFRINSTDTSENCISSQLILNTSEILVTVASTSNFQNFQISIYIFYSENNTNQIHYSFESNSEKVPITINEENKIMIVRSLKNSSGSNGIIHIDYFYLNLSFSKSIEFTNPREVISKTINLNNYRNLVIFSGKIKENNYWSFWIAYYNQSDQKLKIEYKEGGKIYYASSESSNYISKRIISFFGYLKASKDFPTNLYYKGAYPFITFFTDNGRFFNKFGLDTIQGTFTNGIYINGKTASYCGLQYDNSTFKVDFSTKITCPLNAENIDVIEYGCFKNCINNLLSENIFKCDPTIEGCSTEGKIQVEYFCQNGILKKEWEKIGIYETEIQATIIAPNKIEVKFNQTVTANSFNVSLAISKKNKLRITNNVVSDNTNYKLNKFIIYLKYSGEIECATSIKVGIGMMQLLNEMNIPLKQRIVSVDNYTQIQCNDLNSQLSQKLINASIISMQILSSIALGTQSITFNLHGIITMANSMNELSTFQLINCEPIFPRNVNEFLNTTSMFTLHFITNPMDLMLNSSLLFNSNWLENNLLNINYFESTSILYSLMPIILPLVLASILAQFLSSFHSLGHSIMKLRSYIHINIILSIYQGIFYQIFITILIGLFYDDNNTSIFNFISSGAGFVLIFFQLIIIFIISGLLYINSRRMNEPEFEHIFGIFYDGSSIKFPGAFLELVFSVKLQVLLIFSFIFQSFPAVQLSLFVIIYFTTFVLKVTIRPYSDFSLNLQSIIREGLLFLLSLQFSAYYIFIKLNNDFSIILKETILFNFIANILNEFIFLLVGMIQFIVNLFNEERIRSYYLPKQIGRRNYNYELVKNRLFANSNRVFHHFTSRMQNFNRDISKHKSVKSSNLNSDLYSDKAGLLFSRSIPLKSNNNNNKISKESSFLKGELNEIKLFNCLLQAKAGISQPMLIEPIHDSKQSNDINQNVRNDLKNSQIIYEEIKEKKTDKNNKPNLDGITECNPNSSFTEIMKNYKFVDPIKYVFGSFDPPILPSPQTNLKNRFSPLSMRKGLFVNNQFPENKGFKQSFDLGQEATKDLLTGIKEHKQRYSEEKHLENYQNYIEMKRQNVASPISPLISSAKFALSNNFGTTNHENLLKYPSKNDKFENHIPETSYFPRSPNQNYPYNLKI